MDIKVETRIKLDKLKLRDYQIPFADAIENKGCRRVVAILPRRSGKEMTSLYLAINKMLEEVCTVYYVYPTYSRGRNILWESVTNDGNRLLSYIPEELIESKNSQQMSIRLINGSLLKVIGSDNPYTLVGTNPKMIIFSEYAEIDPLAWQLAQPILRGNDGIALFISTPRGKNHFWELYNIAESNPDTWFSYKLSVDDTKHMDVNEIYRDIASGLISEDLAQQEYWCSFELGVEGAFYTRYIDKMRIKGQIGYVPWESHVKVHTCWDIGVADSTVIIFFQVQGQVVRIIDYYENSKQGLEHYVKYLESKPYIYGKHIAPHDIAVKEWGSGMTRIEKAKQLGINFTISNNVPLMDGIESVRAAFSKIWIDETNCKDLIKALENYRQEYDAKRKVYKSQPLHNWSSHAADAARYMCVSLNKVREGASPEDLDKRYNEAVYGTNRGSGFFSDEPIHY